MELKFANKDKSLDDGGWFLDYDFLWSLKEKLEALQDESINTDMETIEAVLLIANGEEELMKKRLSLLENARTFQY